jgi:branched-chain amino acid transport system substrate-binding protein
VTFDSKGNVDESLIQFRSLVDKRIPFVLQGNSSAVASALVGQSTVRTHASPMPACCS